MCLLSGTDWAFICNWSVRGINVGTVRLRTVQLAAAVITTAGLTDSCHVCLGVCVCVLHNAYRLS